MISPGHTSTAEGTAASGQNEQSPAVATPATGPDPTGQTTPPGTGRPPATPPTGEPPKLHGAGDRMFTQADLGRLINARIHRETSG
ncbi:hypothetical protein ACFS2C_03340 [Prauserella oleivorans]|uniref:Uncharacterized protein n=1 Tax=Prauserella oleivorans TaxID=1478153 RepID=A0ABW5W3Q6_9PSEU